MDVLYQYFLVVLTQVVDRVNSVLWFVSHSRDTALGGNPCIIVDPGCIMHEVPTNAVCLI